MSEQYRPFEQMPDPIWRTDSGQLFKALCELLNHNGNMDLVFLLICWGEGLKQELPRLRDELKEVVAFPQKIRGMDTLIDGDDMGKLKLALQEAGFGSDEWVQKQFTKIEADSKSLAWMKTIDPQLKDYLTWDAAARYAQHSATVSDDHKTLTIEAIGNPIPYGVSNTYGDKIHYGRLTETILAKSKTTVKNLQAAIDGMPDEVMAHFLQRPAFSTTPPIPLKESVARLASNPLLGRIEQFVQRAKGAGLS